MKRRLFTLGSAASLLLCIATLALWVGSYYVGCGVTWMNDRKQSHRKLMSEFGVSVSRGEVCIGRAIEDVPEKAEPQPVPRERNGWRCWTDAQPMGPFANIFVDWNWRRLGFGWSNSEGYGHDSVVDPASAGTDRSQALVIPCWFAVLALALLPCLWCARAHQMRRRRRLNLCHSCGYDIRATPGRCPECGAAPPRPPATRPRPVFSFPAWVSTLLCLATVQLWLRSRENYDRFAIEHGVKNLSVCSYKSSIRLGWTRTFDSDPPSGWGCGWSSSRLVAAPIWHPEPQFLGFGLFAYSWNYGPLSAGWGSNIHELAVPDWFLVTAFSILPVTRRAARRRSLRRLARGRCRACGYNLTGNTSGVCPECGAAIPRAGPSA